MNINIANDFSELLIPYVPEEYLSLIRDKLLVFLSDYDIQKKTTEIIKCDSYIPSELLKYLASLKISGGSDSTINGYKIQIINFFKAVSKPLKEVTSDDVLLYFATYKDKRKVKDCTIEHYRIVLNTFFNWCVDEGIITTNPCRRMKPIKYWKDKETALSDYQIESIRSNCSNDRDLAMIDFMLSTGCRVSELTSVKVSDIDFIEKKLDIIGKGNKKRTIYLNGKAIYSISKYLDSRNFDCDILFPSLRSPHLPVKKDAVEKMIRILGNKSKINKLHPHLFRKTMATNALKRGMDITIIQRILGHENIETTMRYINISQDDVQSAHERFVS